jgi:predicted transcriptional regulator
MIQDDDGHAALMRETASLVRAYCETLEIGPADLPALIAYVGAVLRRAQKSRAPDDPGCDDTPFCPDDLPPLGAQVLQLDQFRMRQAAG